ncbi:hypothetical protein RhiJN_24136 [Ceratobasidium sp. AG-Ba]|nr:hypothetical protein RhiJN_24136 [Ceratobasidium sp. AG-Ba]
MSEVLDTPLVDTSRDEVAPPKKLPVKRPPPLPKLARHSASRVGIGKTTGEKRARLEEEEQQPTSLVASNTKLGDWPVIAVKYHDRTVFLKRRLDYKEAIESAKKEFDINQDIRLGTIMLEFGKDTIEISEEAWSIMLPNLRTVSVVTLNKDKPAPTGWFIAASPTHDLFE